MEETCFLFALKNHTYGKHIKLDDPQALTLDTASMHIAETCLGVTLDFLKSFLIIFVL